MDQITQILLQHTDNDTEVNNVKEIVSGLYKGCLDLIKPMESIPRTPGNVLVSSEIYKFHEMMRKSKITDPMFKELKDVLETEISPKCFNYLQEPVTLYRAIELENCPGSLETPARSYMSTVSIEDIDSIKGMITNKKTVMIIRVQPGTILFNLSDLGEELEKGEILLDKDGTFYVHECILSAIQPDIDILKVTYFPKQHCSSLYPQLSYDTLLDSRCSVIPSLYQDGIQNFTEDQLVTSYNNDVRNCEGLNTEIIKRPQESNVRILTYNVHEWKGRNGNDTKHHCVKAILDIDADIVCLQEATNEIPEQLKQVYPYFAMTNSEPTVSEYKIYVAILSKYTITEKEKFLINDNYYDNITEVRHAILAVINGIHIYNVHLSLNREVAVLQLKIISDKISQGKDKIRFPFILCGDFNHIDTYNYTKYEIDWLKRNRSQAITMYNKVRTITRIGGNRTDFNKVKYTVWSARAVDYIFPNLVKFKYIYSGFYYTTASDHLPYFMDLKLKKK
jgi:endonuclease/exonuclease/phosphatase family metal-dependent hydrolase